MGNKGSASETPDDYHIDDYMKTPMLVINFVSCQDIPTSLLSSTADFLHMADNSRLYLRSCVSRNIGTKQEPYFERVSNIVTTPCKPHNSTIVWNSYRDYSISLPNNSYNNSNRFDNIGIFQNRDGSSTSQIPSELNNNVSKTSDSTSGLSLEKGESHDEIMKLLENCYLSIEMVYKMGFEEVGDIIGSINIRIRKLSDESVKSIAFRHHKMFNKEKFPNFSISLRRLFINRELPPPTRTIFLVRHGESKWNKAQATRDIKGLLDFDHSLTLDGIVQATTLNEKWKSERNRLRREYNQLHSLKNDQVSNSSINAEFDNLKLENSTTVKKSNIVNLLDIDENYFDLPSTTTKSSNSISAVPLSVDLLNFDLSNSPAHNHSLTHPQSYDNFYAEENIEVDDESDYSDECEDFEDSDNFAPRSNEGDTSDLLDFDFQDKNKGNTEKAKSQSSEDLGNAVKINSNDNVNLLDIDDVPNNFHAKVINVPAVLVGNQARYLATDEFSGDKNAPLILNAVEVTSVEKNCKNISVNRTLESSEVNSDSSFPDEAEKYNFRDAKMLTNFQSDDKDEIIQYRRDQFIEKFLSAERIFCSPLTRAIETAVVSLEGHPGLLNGLNLYSVIREIKGIGGVDTVGKVYGDQIIERLVKELSDKLGSYRTKSLLKTREINESNKNELLNNSPIDRRAEKSLIIELNDANYPWWTPASSFDNENDVADRMRDFMFFCRYAEEDKRELIFVGHSLFFKSLYSQRISKMLKKNRPEMASNLKKYRLSNASVLALTLFFPNNGLHSNESSIIPTDSRNHRISNDKSIGVSNKETNLPPTAQSKANQSLMRGDAIIIDADILFGGSFHGELMHSKSGSRGTRRTNSVRLNINNGQTQSTKSTNYSDMMNAPSEPQKVSASNNSDNSNVNSNNNVYNSNINIASEAMKKQAEHVMSGIGSYAKEIMGKFKK